MANDLKFIETIVEKLALCDGIQPDDFTIM